MYNYSPYLVEDWVVLGEPLLLHHHEPLGPAPSRHARLADLQQILQQDDDVSEIELPTLRQEVVLDKGRQLDGVFQLRRRQPMTLDVLINEKVESERDDKLEGTRAVLRRCRGELASLLNAQDWTEDVRDDVMEQEALVGNEKGNKRHQVRVDPWVD